MPAHLERADRAARAAAELLGRRLPPTYPGPAPHERASRYAAQRRASLYPRDHAAPDGPRESLSENAIEELVADAGRDLLERAVEAERAAIAAQAAAVECIRQAGRGRWSWADIGRLAGVSSQAAHKRWRERADGPEAQATIDDELDREATS